MYKKILVPVDGSDTSNRGLNEAIQLAKELGSQLKLLHVVNEFVLTNTPMDAPYMPDIVKVLRELGEKTLQTAESSVRNAGLDPQKVLLESLGGSAADLIIKEARSWPADLIVMGTHGRRGIRRLALGSDAEHVLRYSHVPVLLVRNEPEVKDKQHKPLLKLSAAK